MSKLTTLLFNYTYEELMEMDLPNSVKDNVRNNTAFCLMANDVLLDLMGLMADYGYDEKYKAMAERRKKLFKKPWVKKIMQYEFGKKIMFFIFG